MNRNLTIALVIIGGVVAILLNNAETIRVDFYVWVLEQKQSLVFLGFFMSGILAGLLLKNS